MDQYELDRRIHPKVITSLRSRQYTDAETGLQYLRARYYDPDSGQFITRDPLVSSTRDAYGYAGRSPLNATDPTGLDCGWADPVGCATDAGGAIVDGGADVKQRAEDVAIAVVNSPLTEVTAGVNFATGGDCGWGKHLMVVCEGGVLSDHGGTAFTTGNTVNVSTGYQGTWRESYDDLIEHESNHATQWAVFGPVFLPLYGLANRNGACNNIFEQQAGLREGLYQCGGGSASGRSNAPTTAAYLAFLKSGC